ncbi:MAG TPA: glycosyltransferase, partial [Bacteroidota bacterium]|nr:glycosyltransferase [Bacteroidota bacterium]
MSNRPRLCLAGPMVGRTPGFVTTQGEILSDHLAAEGYQVISTSTVLNRYLRLVDIARTLIASRGRVDILLVQTFSGASFVVADISSWIGRRLGWKVLFHLHGGALPLYMARFPRWYRRVFDRADAMVAPSHYLAREIGKHGYRVRVIANSLDLSDYEYRLRENVGPRLFWMRSFHTLYNPQLAVSVLARLRRDGIDATLVMAGGDKGERPATEELARTLGVSAHV